MANLVVTCNAAAKQLGGISHPAVVGVPQTQQFHWARPQATAFAASSAAESFDIYRSSSRGVFVRPDLVDATDDALAFFVQKTNRPRNMSSKPEFRSALEQVSFETNNSLLETSQAKPRGRWQSGILSKAAQILRK